MRGIGSLVGRGKKTEGRRQKAGDGSGERRGVNHRGTEDTERLSTEKGRRRGSFPAKGANEAKWGWRRLKAEENHETLERHESGDEKVYRIIGMASRGDNGGGGEYAGTKSLDD